jgi:hypothetical protein
MSKAKKCVRVLVAFVAMALSGCHGSSDAPGSASPANRAEPGTRTAMRTLSAADLHFDPDRSTAVLSSAQKFIIPVPAFGGEPLVYPEGHDKSGQKILDFEGRPIGERGVIFFNDKDQSVQAVAGDGEGVVIVNEVTADQAGKLHQKIGGFNPDPNALTLSQLKQVLDYARTELKLGDMYNSTRAFVREKMTPAVNGEAPRANGKEIEDYGFKKRDDRDICRAVYVPGAFVLEGPAATAQIFEDGGVVVEQGGEIRGVQPEVFVRTYRLLNGDRIASLASDVKAWR